MENNNRILKISVMSIIGSLCGLLMVLLICSNFSYAEESAERPAAPAELKITHKASGLQLSWKGETDPQDAEKPGTDDLVAEVAKYRLYRKTPNAKWKVLAETEGLSYLDKKMVKGTEYTYAVTAINEASKESLKSETASATFCLKPDVTYTRKAGGVRIQIKNNTGAPKLRIFRTYKGEKTRLVTLNTKKTKEFLDPDVKNAEEYTYQVACLDSSYRRASALSDKKILLFYRMPAVTLYYTKTGVKAKWAGISKAPNYRVYCKKGTDAWKALKTLSATEYEQTSLEEGKRYKYRVAVVSADRKEVLSARSVAEERLFYKPPEVNITINNPANIRLKWNAKKGVNKYQITRKGDDGSTKVFKVTRKYDPAKKAVSYIDNRTKEMQPMKDAVQYKYYIRAAEDRSCISGSSDMVKGLLFTEKTRYLTLDSYLLHDSINDDTDSIASDLDGPIDFSDANRPPTFKKIPFNGKIKLRYMYKRTTGAWYKAAYTNKKGITVTGYIWENYPESNNYVQRLSKTKQKIDYERYSPFVESTENTREHKNWQKEIIEQALFFYNKPTQYCHSHYGTQHSATYRSYDLAENKWTDKRPATRPYWFDCSNFTSYCLNTVMKKYIPTYKMSQSVDAQWGFTLNDERTTDAGEEIKEKAKAAQILYHDGNGGFVPEVVLKNTSDDPSGYKLDLDKLEPCDLIFIYEKGSDKTENKTRKVTHVLMYLGNNEAIHCTGKLDVAITRLVGTKYESRFVGALRMIPESTAPMNKTMTATTDLSVRKHMDKNLQGTETVPENEKVNVLYQIDLVITNTSNGYYSIQRRKSETSLRKAADSDDWHHASEGNNAEPWERYRFVNDDTSWSYIEYNGTYGYVKTEYLN